ncbi:type III secretion system cytoplasmic ring protein SctQ [Sulfidibacter corallicola]|uniref:Type III secretion system cytoplasmic ring protein SctQ n=1 Tax=Sulfidibacter corallicola TaxID=2818388 RepID=A0A8A4TPW5_SULCO|nr:type III secretion system cytoplasmic ring protein SctQ [Sulfidibacter corallicola]QTD51122.1 type III secretion system cytoplasmic ring protein SctQ [Sulfidibacter corallicola]
MPLTTKSKIRPRAFRPRKIPSHEAYLYNRIFRKNGCMTLTLGDVAYTLIFSPTPIHYEPIIAFEIGAGESQVRIGLEHMGFMNDQHQMLLGQSIEDLPDELRAAVFELIQEDVMRRFEAWSGLHSRIRQLLYPIQERDTFDRFMEGYGRTLHFRLIRTSDGQPIRGHISFRGNAMALFADLLEKVQQVALGNWSSLPFPASLEIGRTRLRFEDLSGLDRHDIVLMDNHAFAREGKASLSFPGGLVLGGPLQTQEHQQNQQLIVESMHMNQHEHTDASQAGGLDELEVDLVFEVGRKSLTLGDLRAIQAGFVIDLEHNLDKPITIRANGKVIGSGELVQVEDNLGVRFLELFDGQD